MLKLERQFSGPFHVWKLPEPGEAYAAGADPAGGKHSGDWCACTVVDRWGSPVAVWRGKVEPRVFAQIIIDICEFYGQFTESGQIPLCPEGNNHGIALIDELRALGYWNLYTRQQWDRISKEFIPSLGFLTSLKTKPILLNRGKRALADRNCIIRSRVILEEASTYIINDAGREEAMEGKNDDTLMSWLLALEACHVMLLIGEEPRDGAPSIPQKPAAHHAKDRSERSAMAWEALQKTVEENESPRRVVYIQR